MSNQNSVQIWTDGSCSHSSKEVGGKGGWACLLIFEHTDQEGNKKTHRKEICGGFRKTTSNRMEIYSAIAALSVLKNDGCNVIIKSDSQYLCNSINKQWVFKWERIDYYEKKNSDLWKQFMVLYRRHNVKMEWVKGHGSDKNNLHVDEMAVSAGKNAVEVDHEYEKIIETKIF